MLFVHFVNLARLNYWSHEELQKIYLIYRSKWIYTKLKLSFLHWKCSRVQLFSFSSILVQIPQNNIYVCKWSIITQVHPFVAVSILQTSVLLTSGLRLCLIVLELSRNWRRHSITFWPWNSLLSMTVLQRLCAVLYDDGRLEKKKPRSDEQRSKEGNCIPG